MPKRARVALKFCEISDSTSISTSAYSSDSISTLSSISISYTNYYTITPSIAYIVINTSNLSSSINPLYQSDIYGNENNLNKNNTPELTTPLTISLIALVALLALAAFLYRRRKNKKNIGLPPIQEYHKNKISSAREFIPYDDSINNINPNIEENKHLFRQSVMKQTFGTYQSRYNKNTLECSNRIQKYRYFFAVI
jgi:LPXTG-motif cell wall-anchored protein